MEGIKINFLARRFTQLRLLEVWGLEKNERYIIQLARSLIVSVIALTADFGTLIFLKQTADVHYLLAAGIGFMIGVAINYYLSVTWVFTARQLTSKTHEFAIFTAINIVGLIGNLLIIAGMVEILAADYRMGKAVSTVIVFFWNFLMRKKVLF